MVSENFITLALNPHSVPDDVLISLTRYLNRNRLSVRSVACDRGSLTVVAAGKGISAVITADSEGFRVRSISTGVRA